MTTLLTDSSAVPFLLFLDVVPCDRRVNSIIQARPLCMYQISEVVVLFSAASEFVSAHYVNVLSLLSKANRFHSP